MRVVVANLWMMENWRKERENFALYVFISFPFSLAAKRATDLLYHPVRRSDRAGNRTRRMERKRESLREVAHSLVRLSGRPRSLATVLLSLSLSLSHHTIERERERVCAPIGECFSSLLSI